VLAPSNGAAQHANGASHPVTEVQRPPRTVTFDDADDLDVPDFLK
jgi:hypothetical protein